MERIGTQVRLPLSTAMQITLQGIKIRLGRSLVTLSGVVLGIAFLMSVLTGQLIMMAVKKQQELLQTVNLMQESVKSEVGDLQGRTIAVAVFGKLDKPSESMLLSRLIRGKARLQGYQVPATFAGVQSVGLDSLGKDAWLLIVLGNEANVTTPLATLTAGMKQQVMLDSWSGEKARVFPDLDPDPQKKPGWYKFFFGAEAAKATAALAAREAANRARTVWIVVISLLVSVIGIANALLMSVTERFKEIGTMKCLGAMSGFIRTMFLIESALIGFVGSLVGIIIGALFPMLAYGFTFGFGLVFSSMNYGIFSLTCLGSLLAGTLLSVLAGIYPATFAAKMVPAMALRSNV